MIDEKKCDQLGFIGDSYPHGNMRKGFQPQSDDPSETWINRPPKYVASIMPSSGASNPTVDGNEGGTDSGK